MITRPRRGAGAALLAAVMAAGVASCGSAHAGQAAPSAHPVRLSLATSADYPDGSWAVLVMGGSGAQHNDFWQVFVRPGQAGAWKLATPRGVASNGGITVAAEGGPALPAGTSSIPDGGATLAAVPGGFEALTARGSQFSVWALSSGGSRWDRSQVINVAIPYGSSS